MNSINNNDYACLNELLQYDKYELLIEVSFFHRFCEKTRPFNRGWFVYIIKHIEQLEEEPQHGDCIYIDIPQFDESTKIALHFVHCNCANRPNDRRLMMLIHEERVEWEPDIDDEFPLF